MAGITATREAKQRSVPALGGSALVSRIRDLNPDERI